MFSQASVSLSTWGSWLFPKSLVPGSFWGYPNPRFFPRSVVPCLFQGLPQSQVLSQVCGPMSFLGVPQYWHQETPVPPGRGTPVPAGGGYPRTGVPPGQDRTGLLPSQDRTGVSLDWERTGVPLAMTGIPPSQDWGTPRQNSKTSTCYPAGGMPLAVTQEDFLVQLMFLLT